MNLTGEYFSVVQGPGGKKTLTLSGHQKPMIVVFMGSADNNSIEFMRRVYGKFVSADNRIAHGILDISTFPDIVRKARDTSTPITSIPLFIVYINGRPIAKFLGAANERVLSESLTEALKSVTPQGGQGQRQPQGSSGARTGEYQQGGGGGGGWAAAAPQPAPRGGGGGNYVYSAPPPPGGGGGGGRPYVPDIGNDGPPRGALKGQGNMGAADMTDDNQLMMPDEIIPYNRPWTADYE